MCSLEQAHPDDGLLPMLSRGCQPVQSLTVLTTQLLPESHQNLLRLLMVSVQLLLQLHQLSMLRLWYMLLWTTSWSTSCISFEHTVPGFIPIMIPLQSPHLLTAPRQASAAL